MNRPGKQELEQHIAALRAKYAERLDGRLRELEQALTALESFPDVDAAVAAESLDTVIRLAHRLHGTAGSYGFPEVGLAAGRIEEVLRSSTGTVGTNGSGRPFPLPDPVLGRVHSALEDAFRHTRSL